MVMEKINVAELLKDCPEGMELDCTMFEKPVKYIGLTKSGTYVITIKTSLGKIFYLTKDGHLYDMDDAKCIIFPKGKTTWEGFVPPCKFKIEKGKWYVCIRDLLDNYANKAFRKGDTYLSTKDGSLIPSNSNVPFKVACPDTYFRDWTIQDAKDGDVLVCDINKAEIGGDVEKLPNIVSTIFIFKNVITSRDYIHSYCHLYDRRFLGLQSTMYYNSFVYNIHPAANEQRDLLFQKIKEAGCKWNLETKYLEKLPKFKVGDIVQYITDSTDRRKIEEIDTLCNMYHTDSSPIMFEIEDEWEIVPNKFDIATLKPFDKVLVRGDVGQKWTHDFFGFMDKDKGFPFVCVGHYVIQCIPYEGNKHLLGTTDDCEEYFKTWSNGKRN